VSDPAPSQLTDQPSTAESRRLIDRRLELIAVIIMSLTAICTAWTGFQASKWSGVMSIRFSEANATRTESVRMSDLAGAQRSIDIDLGLNWVRATAQNDDALAEFLSDRFPDHLRVAVDAWVAMAPLDNPDAPSTPFEMSEYVLVEYLEAAELRERADEFALAARSANQQADDYVMLTILFALVIFFAALSTKLEHPRNRRVLLVLSVVFLAVGVGGLSTFRVEI